MAMVGFTNPPEDDQAAEAEADALAQAARERKIKAAMAWLQEAMGGKSQPAAEMITQAQSLGIARTTLTTARHRLSIRTEKRAEGWHWIPPRQRKKQPVTV